MNQIAYLSIGISTRKPEQSSRPTGATALDGQQVASLATRSRRQDAAPERNAWRMAWQRLDMFAALQTGWDAGTACPPNAHTIQYARELLATLKANGFHAPIINPSPDGAIYAHWNTEGIDIELILEGPYEVYALIDDSQSECDYDGEDLKLKNISKALSLQSTRSSGRYLFASR